MHETYKYSILEKKHVTLQMGSSTAMKREGNFNQGFSRVDGLLLKTLKYSGTSKQAQTRSVSKKNQGFFPEAEAARSESGKIHFCIYNKTHDAGGKSWEKGLSKCLLQWRKESSNESFLISVGHHLENSQVWWSLNAH